MKFILRTLFSTAILCLVLLFIYEQFLFKDLSPRSSNEVLRVGYINLHAAKISEADLKRLSGFGCDVWFFLEWNGDNLQEDSTFRKRYSFSAEFPHPETYGVCVLSKHSFQMDEEGKDARPYSCDYAKHLIKFADKQLPVIHLVHAPPPLPKCGLQTDRYVSDLLKEVKRDTTAPALVIGDLNSLPWQFGPGAITKHGFTDTYNALGGWPALTFGPVTWLPKILRLDYVFHRGITPNAAQIFKIASSDHAGYVCDFVLKR